MDEIWQDVFSRASLSMDSVMDAPTIYADSCTPSTGLRSCWPSGRRCAGAIIAGTTFQQRLQRRLGPQFAQERDRVELVGLDVVP